MITCFSDKDIPIRESSIPRVGRRRLLPLLVKWCKTSSEAGRGVSWVLGEIKLGDSVVCLDTRTGPSERPGEAPLPLRS